MRRGATCQNATALIYNRYARWARRVVWKSIFDALAHQNEDSLFFIDSSIVKAHRAATGARGELAQDIGRSRGGRTSKVHAVVDESGRPRHLIITGGQVHDSQVMIDLLNGAGKSKAVVADKPH